MNVNYRVSLHLVPALARRRMSSPTMTEVGSPEPCSSCSRSRLLASRPVETHSTAKDHFLKFACTLIVKLGRQWVGESCEQRGVATVTNCYVVSSEGTPSTSSLMETFRRQSLWIRHKKPVLCNVRGIPRLSK